MIGYQNQIYSERSHPDFDFFCVWGTSAGVVHLVQHNRTAHFLDSDVRQLVGAGRVASYQYMVRWKPTGCRV